MCSGTGWDKETDVNGGDVTEAQFTLVKVCFKQLKWYFTLTHNQNIYLECLLKYKHHGLKEEAVTSPVLSVLHLQPDMQRHWFLSLFFITGNSAGQSTGIPACAAMVTWATVLCVVGHIKAFTQDGQKGGLSERGGNVYKMVWCEKKIKQ